MNISSFQGNKKKLKIYANIFDKDFQTAITRKWVFDVPEDGVVTFKKTGDPVLDPVVVVNDEEFLHEEDPLNRSGVQTFLRTWSRLGF